MNPLGQPPLVRVIRAQEKSPPQLSWETMISLADTTRSTYATCPTEPAGFTPAFHHATAPTAGVPFVIRLIARPSWWRCHCRSRAAGRPAGTIR